MWKIKFFQPLFFIELGHDFVLEFVIDKTENKTFSL